jgi:hypothetical protein
MGTRKLFIPATRGKSAVICCTHFPAAPESAWSAIVWLVEPPCHGAVST